MYNYEFNITKNGVYFFSVHVDKGENAGEIFQTLRSKFTLNPDSKDTTVYSITIYKKLSCKQELQSIDYVNGKWETITF